MTDPQRTGTEEYYRARALEYDRVYEKAERHDDLAQLERLLCDELAGHHVLEVAAGTGYWTARYADVASSVLATDVSRTTLDVACGRRIWPATVSFAEADAFGLDRVEGGFDAAFVGFFWSHVRLEQLDAFLAGLARRVGRGATIVVADNRYVPASNHAIARTDERGNTYQLRHLDDATTWEVLKNFPEKAAIRNALGRVAQDVRIEELTYFWVACSTVT